MNFYPDHTLAATGPEGDTITLQLWGSVFVDEWIALWWNHTTGEQREQPVKCPVREGWRETTLRRMRETAEVHQTPAALLYWRNRRRR